MWIRLAVRVAILQVAASATGEIEALVVADLEIAVLKYAVLHFHEVLWLYGPVRACSSLLVIARPVRQVPLLLLQFVLLTLPQVAKALH